MKAGRAESRVGRILGLGALGLGLALTGGCGLDNVTIPPIDGPATNALSVVVTADPDWLKADGVSTAVITAFLRDTQGRPVSGRGILFDIQEVAAGINYGVAKVGALSAGRAVSGSDGRARVVYTAPPSKEMASNSAVFITARPEGNDAAGEMDRSVLINLIALEQRQYPPQAGAVVAEFLTEPRHGPFFVGVPIHFVSIATSPGGTIITQYEWHWDDGTNNFEYGPEKFHTFTAEGTYFVFHSVIDNLGNYDSRNHQIDVQPAP